MPLTRDQLEALSSIGFKKSPVAVAFLDTPPAGLSKLDRPQPAGCGFWKEAAEGRSFYTSADDHANCPVGAFTHGAELSADKSAELQGLIGTMIELKYLDPAEISRLPHRTSPLKIAAYAPVSTAAFAPDVVVFSGNVRQIMLMSEAARAAGVFETGAAMGRPACAMIPQAINSSSAVASVGCIGNRVYTELGDDELYLTVPGEKMAAVFDKLAVILNANRALESFHQQRKTAI
jgi:uncharacterized protein (DUF169 family)